MADYSTLNESDLAAIERSYGFEISSWTPIDGGMANSSFRAETSVGPLVISILDNADETLARRLASTTAFMHRMGVPTCEVVSRLDGDWIHLAEDKLILIKRWIDGATHKVVPHGMLAGAGRLLRRIHETDPQDLDVPVGSRRLSVVHRRMLQDFPNQEHAEWVRDRLRKIDEYFPPVEDPRRVLWTTVHGDLIGPNIVTAPDGKLYAIDWETATIDDPMLDIGMSAMNMCVVGNVLNHARLQLFLDGYGQCGRSVNMELVRPGIEYAAVIVAFHRYRRHNIRFPNAARSDYYRLMVDFVEQEFNDRSGITEEKK